MKASSLHRKDSQLKNWILLAFAYWTNITTTSGFVYGMSALINLMDKELDGKGQLWKKCNGISDCTGRDQVWTTVFSIAVGFVSGGSAIVGFIMDYCGPKAACLLGLITFTVGNYLMATTDSDKDGLHLAILKFIIGFSCIAVGGNGPYISSYNVANISNNPTTVTSIIAAVFNLAGLVYLALHCVLDQIDVNVEDQRNIIGWTFVYLGIGNFIVAYFIWPVRAFTPNSSVTKLVDFHIVKGASSSKSATVKNIEYRDRLIPLHEQNVRAQICSKEFFLINSFYAFFLLSMSCYFGTIFLQMDTKEDRSWLQTVFLLAGNAAPVFFAWPCAKLLDRFGFAFGIGATCICSGLMFFLLISDSVALYLISTGMFAIFRTFFFSTFYGFVGEAFGFNNYGVIVGAATISGALVSQFALVLNDIGFNIGFIYVDVGLVIGALIFFPFSLTLGVWESDLSQEHNHRLSFGRLLTYNWSRIGNVSTGRLKLGRQNAEQLSPVSKSISEMVEMPDSDSQRPSGHQFTRVKQIGNKLLV